MKKVAMILVLAVGVVAAAMLMDECGEDTGQESAVTTTREDIVGGPCSYQEFAGACEYSREADGKWYFAYKGSVRGEDVELEENESDSSIIGTFDCRLAFITEGTCTPCLIFSDAFSFGSCGAEAWALFSR